MSIKKGFKNAVNKFGKTVNTKSSQTFKEKGIGSNFEELGNKAAKGPLSQFKTGMGSTIIPPIKKAAVDAFGMAKGVAEEHNFKGKINDIVSTVGLNKDTVNNAFDKNLKEYGVTGIGAESIKNLNVENIKNLKSNLNIEDFKMDANEYLPAGGINSVNPMEEAKKVGIGSVSNSGLNLNEVSVTKFINGDISNLNIGGSDVKVLKESGASDKIDVSSFSKMLKNNKENISNEFNSPVDFKDVSNTFNTDIFNKDALKTDVSLDNINLDDFKFGESVNENNLLTDESVKNNVVAIDAADYGAGNFMNNFEGRHGNFGDATINIDQVNVTEFLDSDFDVNLPASMSDDYTLNMHGHGALYDSTKEGLKGAFTMFDNAGNVKGAIFDTMDMTENSEHAKALSKKYTDSWGSSANEWSNTYSGMLAGETTGFKDKFNIKNPAWKSIADFDSKKWLLDLRENLTEKIHGLFGI